MVDDGGCSGVVVVVACTTAAFLVSVTEKFELEGRTAAAAVGREGDDFNGLVRMDIFSGLGADVP